MHDIVNDFLDITWAADICNVHEMWRVEYFLFFLI